MAYLAFVILSPLFKAAKSSFPFFFCLSLNMIPALGGEVSAQDGAAHVQHQSQPGTGLSPLQAPKSILQYQLCQTAESPGVKTIK